MLRFELLFLEISPDSTDYFHVTSFTERWGEKIKRVMGVADNTARNFTSKIQKIGCGKNFVNTKER